MPNSTKRRSQLSQYQSTLKDKMALKWLETSLKRKSCILDNINKAKQKTDCVSALIKVEQSGTTTL